MFALFEVLPGEDTTLIATAQDPVKLMDFNLTLVPGDSIFSSVESRNWREITPQYWELRDEDTSEMARWRTFFSVGKVPFVA